jgi:hypothetical protein
VSKWTDRLFGGVDPFGFGDLKDRTWFRPLCRWLIVLESIGLLIAGAYVLHAIQGGTSWPAGPLVIVPAAPLLLVGQVTVIVTLLGEPKPGSMTRRRISWDFVTHRDVRIYASQVALVILFYLAVFQGQRAFSSASSNEGNPVGPTSTCRWPLENHGSITCVSHAAYVAAGTSLQRGAAGVILGFFAFQLAILIGFIANRPVVEVS